jgi:cold-inducible RNA-binding protein
MNIYVGNLAHSVDEATLRARFEEFGDVTAVKIIKDRFTGSPRGFAFVEMSVDTDAQRAIEMLNGQDIGGRQVTVNEARPQEPRAGGSNGRFGNHGGGSGSSRPSSGGGFRKPGGTGGSSGGWGGRSR